MNPTPLEMSQRVLSTSIDFVDNSASIDLALSVAKEFRLTEQEALLILNEVSSAVNQWRSVALSLGLSKRECDRMASAFLE